ncbi:MAG TPA: hypothetical protein VFG76_00360 [Candidatus Polarisedimenticolia bacterium]|nr:hypothetical protein [Candidatus Polarisedimenticolia bacterium]
MPISRELVLPWISAVLLAQQAAQESPRRVAGGITTSAIAWIIGGLFLLAAAYFLIRLLEWDHVNKETEGQEDPLAK